MGFRSSLRGCKTKEILVINMIEMKLRDYILRALNTGPMSVVEMRSADWMKGRSENGLSVLLSQMKTESSIVNAGRGVYALPTEHPADTVATTEKITVVFNSVRDMVLSKNQSYGDSVFKPLRLFSKADPVEQIRVRLDDKISRIMRGAEGIDNDADIYRDIMGYCALMLVALGE
jgi:hypothetical protein